VSLTHLSLFSGIGGIDLAAEWAGFETVAFVERDPFCQRVLRKHWPEAPIFDDVTTFDGTGFRGVDSLSGGFPCQDISGANKSATGLDGARSGLWFQMLRVIDEAEPRIVVAENVRQLLNMGIDVCLDGLESRGYQVSAIVCPAAGVGAWHKRDRVFILDAHPDRVGMQSRGGEAIAPRQLRRDGERRNPVEEQAGHDELCGAGTDADGARQERQKRNSCRQVQTVSAQGKRHELVQDFGERSRVFTPKLCGNLHGLPGGMDVSRARLHALGNAVVPAQCYPILKAIADILTP
jgi:DNA (cytosine-5)-methyltransferase 1